MPRTFCKGSFGESLRQAEAVARSPGRATFALKSGQLFTLWSAQGGRTPTITVITVVTATSKQTATTSFTQAAARAAAGHIVAAMALARADLQLLFPALPAFQEAQAENMAITTGTNISSLSTQL